MRKEAPFAAARRQILMDAAEHLIRAEGSTDFTMLALAKVASVSPTTPYNIFKTKARILFALLDRSLDGVAEAGRRALDVDDPFERVVRSAELAAKTFTSDSAIYRPLYRFLLGVDDKSHRQALMARAADFWHVATEAMATFKVFPEELPRSEFDLQLTTNFLGLTDRWAHGELGNKEFVLRAAYGTASLLLSLVTEPRQRARLLAILGAHRPHLVSLSAKKQSARK